MITAKIKVELDLEMKLKNYTHTDISKIKPILEADIIKTLKEAIGKDEVSEEWENHSNISITKLEVEEQKEERGN